METRVKAIMFKIFRFISLKIFRNKQSVNLHYLYSSRMASVVVDENLHAKERPISSRGLSKDDDD